MPKGVTIQLYHALAAGSVPPPGSLIEGELAIDALSDPPRLFAGVPVTRDPSGRINLLAGVGGSAIPLPLAILNGGTGAATASGAFDNLTGAAGSMTGWLTRTPAGTWNLMGATDLAAALAGSWLPISNPTYAGILTTPTSGRIINVPTTSINQSSWIEWGPLNAAFAQIWVGSVFAGQAALSIKQGNQKIGANNIFTANGATQMWMDGPSIAFFAHNRAQGVSVPDSVWEDAILWIEPEGLTVRGPTPNVPQGSGIGIGTLAQWSPYGSYPLIIYGNNLDSRKVSSAFIGNDNTASQSTLEFYMAQTPTYSSDLMLGMRGFNLVNPAGNVGFFLCDRSFTFSFWENLPLPADYPAPMRIPPWVNVTGGFYEAYPSLYIQRDGLWLPHVDARASSSTAGGIWIGNGSIGAWCVRPGTDDWSNVYLENRSPSGMSSFGMASNAAVVDIKLYGSTPPAGIEPGTTFFRSTGYGGFMFQPWCGFQNNIYMQADPTAGEINIFMWVPNPYAKCGYYAEASGPSMVWVESKGWPEYASYLGSNAPNGLWIQNWQASPVGGIHFTVGDAHTGEYQEFLEIDDHGLHIPTSWHDDDTATLDDSEQVGFDVAAGGESVLGAGAGLLMLTATSAPNSTAVFLLGNHRAQLIATSNGNGWVANTDPAPHSKLSIFWRAGKYYVGNGRAASVHLNDMMFKNASE